MSDFQASLASVQPSAKREGFATVPDVTWEDVGALQDIREELTMAILVTGTKTRTILRKKDFKSSFTEMKTFVRKKGGNQIFSMKLLCLSGSGAFPRAVQASGAQCSIWCPVNWTSRMWKDPAGQGGC